jgi:long-chain acyl-CoA synthetase
MKKPWLANYDRGVPGSLNYPQCGLTILLKNSVDRHPDRIAIIQGSRCITYRELYLRSSNLAMTLVNNGLQTGVRIAICLPNQIEFAISFFATLLAGGVVAAFNPTYPVREMVFQAEIAKPKFIIGSRKNLEKIMELSTEYQFDKIFLCRETDDFQIDLHSNNCWIKGESDKNTESFLPTIDPEQMAILQFSGGTTGIPKAAIGLHRNVVANVNQFSRWLSPLLKGHEVFLTAIPLFHVYGMVIGLNVGLNLGATIVLVEDAKDIGGVVKSISRHEVSVLPGVPTLFNAINGLFPDIEKVSQLSTLKVCISGSAPLPIETKTRFEEISGSKLVEGYGLSEAPTATHCNPVERGNRDFSIGLPLPDVDCRILEIESGKISIEPGKKGELLIRGPQVMQGYFDKDEESKTSLEGGWLHTGDIAYMDENGYFYIIGRRKEMIKVNGLQVWPNEIEIVLRQMPGIKEVAVTGIPDRNSGEVAKAWVVLEKGYSVDLLTMREFCENKLAGYKIPRALAILDELPRSVVGKVLKYKLQDKE